MTFTHRKFHTLSRLLVLGLLLCVFGSSCTLTSGALLSSSRAPLLKSAFSVPEENILLPMPSEANIFRDQTLLINLSQYLETMAQEGTERAEIFYELGIIYDRLGLEATARSMFMNALLEKADFAAPYNFVGIYFAEDGRFQDSYDAFHASLELDPRDVYVNFNRAIVLYYAGRAKTALPDLERFYEADRSDPYRQLWFYILEEQVLGEDEALTRLRQRYDAASRDEQENKWGFYLVELYTGKLSEDTLFEKLRGYAADSELYADYLCETYFYLAKLKQQHGDDKLAYDYYRLSAATRRYGFLEYRYALREIAMLEKKYGLRKSIYNHEPEL